MNCRETERLLDTFFDGELDGRLMRDAALHVTRCPSCEREFQEKEHLHAVLVGAIQADVQGVSLDGIWTAVQAGIARDGSTGRSFLGRRAGGRSASGRTRAARSRRAMWGVSTATAGAVAASLFVVLLYPAEQETQEISTGSAIESRPPAREIASPAERPKPSAGPRAFASIAPRAPRVSTVALGPVQVEDPLSPAWSQQVQAGPLESNDPVLSLWRQSTVR